MPANKALATAKVPHVKATDFTAPHRNSAKINISRNFCPIKQHNLLN